VNADVEPSPGVDSTVTSPPIARTSSRTNDRPIPDPRMAFATEVRARKNGSNTRDASPAGSPMPRSTPATRTRSPARSATTAIGLSAAENLTASVSRFPSVRRSRTAGSRRGTLSGVRRPERSGDGRRREPRPYLGPSWFRVGATSGRVRPPGGSPGDAARRPPAGRRRARHPGTFDLAAPARGRRCSRRRACGRQAGRSRRGMRNVRPATMGVATDASGGTRPDRGGPRDAGSRPSVRTGKREPSPPGAHGPPP
jgi:hypothetical protein